jgi:hypothetical protein
MPLLHVVHVLGVGFWLGVLGVETVLERSRTSSRATGYAVARYHYLIDVFLEIPVFVVVLGTGLAMVDPMRLSGWYLVKVVCGLVAVGANAVCVIPVVLRRRAAERDRLTDVRHYSRMIDWTAVVGLPAALVALGLGAWRVV